MPVDPIPPGYHTVTPYLIVNGADRLIEFLRLAFQAQELERMIRSDGAIGHAAVRIGDSAIMLAEATAEHEAMPATIYLYVPDTDATYERAIAAGATSLMVPADQFYGDRNAGVIDPIGNKWWIGTHIEDVPIDELKRRATAHVKKNS